MNLVFTKQWASIILTLLVLVACNINSSVNTKEPLQPSELESLALKKDYNTRQFGTSANDRVSSITINGNRNSVYVAGHTFGNLRGDNLGRTDAFVRKYSINGRKLWTRQFGTNSIDFISAIAANSHYYAQPHLGEVYVAGNTFGSLQGDNLGRRDVFIRKYSADGSELWTRQFGTKHSDFLSDITVDFKENSYVVGYTFGDLKGTNLGEADAFIRKYDINGNKLWTKQFGTSGNDSLHGIEIDPSGNIFVIGTTTGSLQGDNLGNRDAFIRKYSADGSELWTRQFGTRRNDYARGITTDSSPYDGTHLADKVYVVGHTFGNLAARNKGKADAFIRLYDASDGSVLWTDQFGESDSDYANGVGFSRMMQDVYVVGNIKGSLERGVDAFIRRYNSMGDVELIKQFGTSKNDYIKGIKVNDDQVYVAGHTNGDLGGTNLGLSDAFMSNYTDNFRRRRLKNDAEAKYYLKEAVTFQEIYQVDYSSYTASEGELVAIGLRPPPTHVGFSVIAATSTGYLSLPPKFRQKTPAKLRSIKDVKYLEYGDINEPDKRNKKNI